MTRKDYQLIADAVNDKRRRALNKQLKAAGLSANH